jgi:hypothetical protein
MICETCLMETSFVHDHRPGSLGLDDGPPIDTPRKKAAAKPAAEVARIRAAAWATRRAKLGPKGHR